MSRRIWLSKPIRAISVRPPAMNDPMLPLPGLSPAGGKPVVVKFDGGLLSSDGGVLALREVEQRLRLADRIVDPRAPDQVTHSLADIIRLGYPFNRTWRMPDGWSDPSPASTTLSPLGSFGLGSRLMRTASTTWNG